MGAEMQIQSGGLSLHVRLANSSASLWREEELDPPAEVPEGPQHRGFQQPGEWDLEADREARQGDGADRRPGEPAADARPQLQHLRLVVARQDAVASRVHRQQPVPWKPALPLTQHTDAPASRHPLTLLLHHRCLQPARAEPSGWPNFPVRLADRLAALPHAAAAAGAPAAPRLRTEERGPQEHPGPPQHQPDPGGAAPLRLAAFPAPRDLHPDRQASPHGGGVPRLPPAARRRPRRAPGRPGLRPPAGLALPTDVLGSHPPEPGGCAAPGHPAKGFFHSLKHRARGRETAVRVKPMIPGNCERQTCNEPSTVPGTVLACFLMCPGSLLWEKHFRQLCST